MTSSVLSPHSARVSLGRSCPTAVAPTQSHGVNMGAVHGAHLMPNLSFPLIHHNQAMNPLVCSNTSLIKCQVQFKWHQTATVSPEKQVISCTEWQMMSGFPQITPAHVWSFSCKSNIFFFLPWFHNVSHQIGSFLQLYFTQLNEYFHEILCFLRLPASCQTGLKLANELENYWNSRTANSHFFRKPSYLAIL